MAQHSKVGRPAKHYESKSYGTIVGLTRLPSGQWRIQATGHRFRESDEGKAIKRFREAEALRRGEIERVLIDTDAPPVPVLIRDDPAGQHGTFILRDPNNLIGGHDRAALFRHGVQLDSPSAWLWFREQILTRREYVAQQTGFPGIATITDAPSDSTKLPSLWPLYEKHTKATEPKTISKTKDAWDDFVAFVGVKTCDQITGSIVEAYGERISTDPTYSQKTQALIFSRVKAVVNIAAKKNVNVGNLPVKLKALETRLREGDEDEAPVATPMTRAVFRRLLTAAGREGNDQMVALLLMGMNCAMYISEVCDVKWKHIDLDRGTLVMKRGKTGIIRAAVLWPETVSAVKALKAKRPNSAYVLTSHSGTRYNAESCRKWYGEFRDRLEIARTQHTDFRAIRDAAYSEASDKVLIQKVKVLAGHKIGDLSDAYIARNPRYTAEACHAIYVAFMAEGSAAGAANAA